MSDNNDRIPPGWSVPEFFRGGLRKESENNMSENNMSEYEFYKCVLCGETVAFHEAHSCNELPLELRKDLDVVALYISKILPVSGKWSDWIVYLLETLQEKFVDRQTYEDMLLSLRDDLTIRIEGKRW